MEGVADSRVQPTKTHTRITVLVYGGGGGGLAYIRT